MCSSLVAAYSDAIGVCRTTSQVCFFARASRAACRSGSYLAMACGDDGVDGLRAAPVQPGGDLLVDPPGGLQGEGVGEDGDVAALPGGDLEGGDAFPGLGEAVAQLEGVGDQLLGGDRGDAEGDGQRFGGVGRDLRAALAAERLVGQEGFAAPGGHAGLGGGGVQRRPTGGR